MNEYVIHIAGITEKPKVRFDPVGALALARTIVDAINDGKEVRIKYTWPDPHLQGRAPSLDEQAFIYHWAEEYIELTPEMVQYLKSRAKS